jgi:hypothetical protein
MNKIKIKINKFNQKQKINNKINNLKFMQKI